ncbi:MAG: BtpA/SgcQ family protein [Planctomycetes bacterium]|nr:BtpA/SgcQ family protein [Planctomycetota bacterium]
MAPLLERLFGTRHPVIGMVHLLPLPGSPRWGGSMDRVLDRAVADARALRAGGADGILVENYGDLPFEAGAVEPACTAALAVALRTCREASRLPAGVNALRNDTAAALAAAVAGGGVFLRTNVHAGAMATDQGILSGRAAATMRDRARLRAEGVAVFADVLVKHAAALGPRDPRAAARDAVERGLADAVLVTGAATGSRPDFREVAAVRDAVPATPLLCASGVAGRDMGIVAALADGVIVGTSLQRGGRTGNPVDPARVKALVAAARRAWGR